ncbi:MAG TPA: glycerate kinase [Leptolyngbyaceae cyanobacterium M65_K2018_010]|nr:glycerate kinase [Leptolyngbyaceae cyanobacterium M65_K2018_010]
MRTGSNQVIQDILTSLVTETPVTPGQWQALIDWELGDRRRAQAWGITPGNVVDQLQNRLTWLKQVAPQHPNLPLPQASITPYLIMYWQLWLPFAMILVQARLQRPTPLIQGILGGQGTGKTTLTQILRQILALRGYHAVALSLDDLYKTYAERCQLRQADPRLRWRGPPGTHDIPLGIATLERLATAQPGDWLDIPRFDKSLWGGEGDRVAPERVQGVDMVLFEGWFVGVRPIADAEFDRAPAPIQTEPDRQFARDMNRQLQAYLPLWERLHQLMILTPEDYRISQLWRRQAEQRMQASGKPGMSPGEIDQFVEYFWRALHPDLFIAPLKHNPRYVNLVVEMNLDRTPRAIYCPD